MISYWHWWVLALVLLVVELSALGTYYLLVMAVAAAIVGALALLAPGSGWEGQVALFSVMSVAGLLTWHRYRPRNTESDRPSLNRRGDSYVGRVFTLEDPIVNGVGKLRVDDSQWRIAGADAPAGARMRVARADGATLLVERAD